MASDTAGRIVLGCSTLAPKYASSDASSNDSRGTTCVDGHHARIGGHHAVHVGPDLDLRAHERGAEDRRRIVGSAAAERRRHAVRWSRRRSRRRRARGRSRAAAGDAADARPLSLPSAATRAEVSFGQQDPARDRPRLPRVPPPRRRPPTIRLLSSSPNAAMASRERGEASFNVATAWSRLRSSEVSRAMSATTPSALATT